MGSGRATASPPFQIQGSITVSYLMLNDLKDMGYKSLARYSILSTPRPPAHIPQKSHKVWDWWLLYSMCVNFISSQNLRIGKRLRSNETCGQQDS